MTTRKAFKPTPFHLSVLNQLVLVYTRLGDYENAKILNQQTERLKDELYGENYYKNTEYFDNAALLYTLTKEYDKVAEYYNQLAEISRLKITNGSYHLSERELQELLRSQGNYQRSYLFVCHLRRQT